MSKLKLQDKDGNIRIEEVKSSEEYLEEANVKLNHWREIQESITGHSISSNELMKAVNYILGFNETNFEESQIETVVGFEIDEEDNNG